MKTREQLEADQAMLRSDPERYLGVTDERVRQNPNDELAYFSRHQAWDRLGRVDLALADLDRAIALGGERALTTLGRGELLYRLGRFREALAEFQRGETLDPVLWCDFGGPMYAADCLVRLNDGAAAVAMCSKMRNDYWSPGLWGSPRGNKGEITAEIRRRANAGAL